MKEFLSQQGVPFTEFNVARDEQAREEMVRRTGSLAVPTIIVGDEVMVGFDQERLENLLVH